MGASYPTKKFHSKWRPILVSQRSVLLPSFLPESFRENEYRFLCFGETKTRDGSSSAMRFVQRETEGGQDDRENVDVWFTGGLFSICIARFLNIIISNFGKIEKIANSRIFLPKWGRFSTRAVKYVKEVVLLVGHSSMLSMVQQLKR